MDYGTEGNNPGWPAFIVYNGHMAEVVNGHQVEGVGNDGIGFDGGYFIGHVISDLGLAQVLNVTGDLGKDIPFGEDPGQPALIIDQEQTANIIFFKVLNCF